MYTQILPFDLVSTELSYLGLLEINQVPPHRIEY